MPRAERRNVSCGLRGGKQRAWWRFYIATRVWSDIDNDLISAHSVAEMPSNTRRSMFHCRYRAPRNCYNRVQVPLVYPRRYHSETIACFNRSTTTTPAEERTRRTYYTPNNNADKIVLHSWFVSKNSSSSLIFAILVPLVFESDVPVQYRLANRVIFKIVKI